MVVNAKVKKNEDLSVREKVPGKNDVLNGKERNFKSMAVVNRVKSK